MADHALEQPEPGFRILRPFGWGILIIHNGTGIPVMPDDWVAGSICSDEHGVIVPVHHAQDVEFEHLPPEAIVPPFEVEVVCLVRGRAPRPVSYEGGIDLPTGEISIGDADGEYQLRVEPGTWLLQIALDPPETGDHVTVWLSRQTTAS